MAELGRRGEGWFVGQVGLLVAIALCPAWPDLGIPLLVKLVGVPVVGLGAALCVFSLAWLGGNLTPFPRPLDHNSLVITGPYAFVRHPIYTGLVLGCLGWTLFRGSVPAALLTLVLFVYLDRKAAREERWLEEKHPSYADYMGRVKRLVPFVW